MALPASLSTLTVAGTYVDLVGNPVRGSLTFTPETIIIEPTLNVILINSAVTVALDATGSFSIVLPVSDDPDVTPQPFVYTITEDIIGGRTFTISLPLSLANTTLNIADILPLVTLADSVNYMTLNQYASLLSRYNTAVAIYTNATGASASASTVAGYATATSENADFLSAYTDDLMLMGV